jgi:hypothetical protein
MRPCDHAPRRTAHRRTGIGFAVVLAGAALLAPSARADELDDRFAAASKAYMERLQSLATWCDTQKVFGVRDQVFRRMLEVSPDDARARAALKFRRVGPKAPWEQSRDYKAPVDFNKGLTPEGARSDDRRVRQGHRPGRALPVHALDRRRRPLLASAAVAQGAVIEAAPTGGSGGGCPPGVDALPMLRLLATWARVMGGDPA